MTDRSRTTSQAPSLPLLPEHVRELATDSAIDPEVIRERGYATVTRPRGDSDTIAGLPAVGALAWSDAREQLGKLGFPSWAIREDYFYPGLWLPMYDPRGRKLPGQWKPRNPVPNRDGKMMKYASAKSPSRLDVHPRWSRDPDPDGREAALPAILDPDVPLWITEGIKKADSLTSRGICTVALAGVYNWRNSHATLGDWEDVRLKGREVTICFDADTVTKAPIQKAMARLGAWLKHKGARKVWYLVVPPGVNGKATKGVDDFFAAGGTVTQLEQAYRDKPPRETVTADAFTDSKLAEVLAEEVLDGRYIWSAGMEWMGWTGRHWEEVSEVTVIEAVRTWALDRFADAVGRLKAQENGATEEVDGWRPMLGANRQKTVLNLARGIVERRAAELDSDPDLLNTPSGVVDLRTGDLLPHDPDLLITKITKGAYRPGYTHEDWTRALTALPEESRGWYQVRVGQGVTGYTTPDGILPLLQGGGENGKSALSTDGILPALGAYASIASPKLLQGSKNEHSTEMADLRGMRFVIAEELAEGKSIDVTALKRIMDVGRIRARRVHKDNMEFQASHSLFATTNYIPVVSETDHGTWRRLALVTFPYRFRKPGEELESELDRPGDPTLKDRIKAGTSGQHDAIVTWAVEGAVRWYQSRAALEEAARDKQALPADVMSLPDRVAADTLEWRKTADRVLGFWEACLIVDRTAAVLSTELTEHFNAWLQASGHTAWAKETFVTRFAGHQRTTAARVVKKRIRDHSAIMRRPTPPGAWLPPGGQGDLPKQPEVWLGVRYRTAEDDL